MGFSLEWMAVKGGTRESVLDALGLRGTGEREEIPEAELTGAALPAGWYLLVANHSRLPLMDSKVLAGVSVDAEVVSCFVEEHVMCSCVQGWQRGREVWSVMHMADTGGIDHLETKGELPPAFAPIRDQQRAKQQAAGGAKAGVDYIFDIPVELACTLTGYRHDQDIPGLDDTPFEVLATTEATPRRSWLRKILGI